MSAVLKRLFRIISNKTSVKFRRGADFFEILIEQKKSRGVFKSKKIIKIKGRS